MKINEQMKAEPFVLPKTSYQKFLWWLKGLHIMELGGDDHTFLVWSKAQSIEFGGGGIGFLRVTNPACSIFIPQRNYWCSCGTKLTDGPCGGSAINAVCKNCRINYGCLEGYGL
jgi:hypothetical protein